jgi:D-alanyl-D-alanine carboxypeptidase
MRIILIVALSSICVTIVAIAIALYNLKRDTFYISKFLFKNPNRSSIYFIRNDSVLLDLRGNMLMPLASTVKIIIAIEYSRQISGGLINKSERVKINELNKYYFPSTDGGAHSLWLNEMTKAKKIIQESVLIDDVVMGMIRFSTNANAEFLIDRLGIDSINQTIKRLGIVRHTYVYPFVSSLLVCTEFDSLTPSELIRVNKELSDSEYISKSIEYHKRVKNGEKFNLKNRLPITKSIQSIWSDRFTASTTEEYSKLMYRINKENLLGSVTGQIIKKILELPKEVTDHKRVFTSFGIKGGSTAFVITTALYATDSLGNFSSLAIFFNNLKDWERIIIEWNCEKFQLRLLSDKEFRDNVIATLKKKTKP